MNANANAFTETLRKSSLRKPHAPAASAYSRESDVAKTPGSSVEIVNGWLALCTRPRWCFCAAAVVVEEALSFFGVPASSSVSFPCSFETTPSSILPVIALLVIQSSIGIFSAFSLDHSASSRTVQTQCPKRSGLKRNMCNSSCLLQTSPQCRVMGRPFLRASRNAGSNVVDHRPTVGFPETSTPTTPQSVSRRYAARRTVRFASTSVSFRSMDRINRATTTTSCCFRPRSVSSSFATCTPIAMPTKTAPQ
mmetsp:Transcript_3719/g.13763  ORF Transcript_3719/g.13763 Transcript_3719/m.13763 type:complete len:251 (+) Transcript_3719:1119-1871(+)